MRFRAGLFQNCGGGWQISGEILAFACLSTESNETRPAQKQSSQPTQPAARPKSPHSPHPNFRRHDRKDRNSGEFQSNFDTIRDVLLVFWWHPRPISKVQCVG
jgi:hypothetical protein